MKELTMKWFYCSGIFLICFLKANCEYHEECLVYDVSKGYHQEIWSGEEITFYAFVLENGTVNIKITYIGLDKSEFFTNLYFSPSIKLSRRQETKHGDDQTPNNLTTMEISNDWFEFKIWSLKGSIMVSCEPNIHEIIPISQTSHTLNDLTIYASNISLCKDERTWKVFEGNNVTIPFGEAAFHKSFLLEIDPSHDIRLIINNYNSTEKEFSNDYILTIERNKVTFQPLNLGENMKYNTVSSEITTLYIFSTTGNVTTLNIFSKAGNTTVSVFFETKPPSSLRSTLLPAIHREDCPSCNDTLYIYLIPPLVIFIICTIIVAIGFRSASFRSRIKKMKSLKCNGKPEQSSRDLDQYISLSRNENNNGIEEADGL